MIKNISIIVCIIIIILLSFVLCYPDKQPQQPKDTKQVPFYYRSGNFANNWSCKKDFLDKILEKKNECIEKVLAPYNTEHHGEMEDWDTGEIEGLVSLCNQQIITLYCFKD